MLMRRRQPRMGERKRTFVLAIHQNAIARVVLRRQRQASANPLLRKRFALKISGLLATHSKSGVEWGNPAGLTGAAAIRLR